MVFETKKIKNETLSEYLLEIRAHLGLTVDEVSSKTGVSSRFIHCLENGNLRSLPPDVYVIGFLKELSAFYGVATEDLIFQFKKERGIVDQIISDQKKKKANNFGLIITPKLMSLTIAILFVLVTVGYIAWEIVTLNSTPSLTILQPYDGIRINDSFVKVVGKTNAGNEMEINGQAVFVDQDGNFQTTLGLAEGQKTFTFKAKNKFDKTVEKSISIIADIPNKPEVLSASVNETGQVELEIVPLSNINIAYIADDKPLVTQSLSEGKKFPISAKSKIFISTNDAGSTRVLLNGNDLGVLGKKGEALSDVPFSSDTKSIN